MSNDYGKPRKRFLVQVKERHGKTWRQHLLCDTHNAARAAVDHLSAIDAKHTYRVEGEPRPERPALPPLDTAQPVENNKGSTEYPSPHIPTIRKSISTTLQARSGLASTARADIQSATDRGFFLRYERPQ